MGESQDKTPQRRAGRRPTAVDVARLSGVSRATVSYVLNNVPNQTIPAQTRARVREAAAALGYVPSAAAASLRRGHSKIILMVTDEALTGFVTEPFLAAISERITAAGYTALTHQFVSDEALLSLVREIRPFGVLALTGLSPRVVDGIRDTGVPRWYSSAHGDEAFPRPWEEEIGAIQARHLLDRGVSSIVYAAPPEESPRSVIARSRAIGASRACEERGLPAPRHTPVPLDPALAANLLFAERRPGRSLGVCAFDDVVAAVVLAAARDRRLNVPEDVAVIGVDDTPFAALLTPPLTTVSVDARRTGSLLADRFLAESEEQRTKGPSHVITTIITRSSA